jgi:hypothetical protein
MLAAVPAPAPPAIPPPVLTPVLAPAPALCAWAQTGSSETVNATTMSLSTIVSKFNCLTGLP